MVLTDLTETIVKQCSTAVVFDLLLPMHLYFINKFDRYRRRRLRIRNYPE